MRDGGVSHISNKSKTGSKAIKINYEIIMLLFRQN